MQFSIVITGYEAANVTPAKPKRNIIQQQADTNHFYCTAVDQLVCRHQSRQTQIRKGLPFAQIFTDRQTLLIFRIHFL